MGKILNYLNALDQDAIVNEEHLKDPVQAMTDFGLCKEEQTAFLTGDREKIAQYAGVDVIDFSVVEYNITTF